MDYYKKGVDVPKEFVTQGVPVITTDHALIHLKRGFEISGTFAANGTAKALLAFNPPKAAAAKATIVMTDADANLLYTFTSTGFVGNDYAVVHLDPSGNSQPLTVRMVGKVVTVSLATNADGNITSTAALVAAAVNASEAAEFVTCTLVGTGAVVNAVSVAALTGGASDVYVHFQTGDFTAAADIVTLRVIEGATYTGTAATFTPVNKSRIRALRPSRVALAGTLAATVTTPTGSVVMETMVARGSASGQSRTSISKDNGDEWVFSPGLAYLFEFTPTGATAIDYRFFWYEEDEG